MMLDDQDTIYIYISWLDHDCNIELVLFIINVIFILRFSKLNS